MKQSKYLIRISVFILLCFVGYFWAYQHVEYETGDTPRTYDCISCHVDARGINPIDRLLKPQYYSPQNLAVSNDGSTLYVTASDSDALLVLDLDSRSLASSIGIGKRPHDVVLNKNGTKAFVSNEWDDSVVEIDLDKRRG